MTQPTPGALSLRAYFDSERGAQAKLRTALQISQAAASAWASGKARPEPAYRTALEILLRIPAKQWDTAEDRAIVKRARALRRRADRRRTAARAA